MTLNASTAAFASLKSVEDTLDTRIGAVGYAPNDSAYILKSADPDLANAQSLGALTTGLLKNIVSGSTGTLSRAVPGTDYESPLAFNSPLGRSTDTISLAVSGVTAGSCTNYNLTIGQYGRVTVQANGSSGGVSSLRLEIMAAEYAPALKTRNWLEFVSSFLMIWSAG